MRRLLLAAALAGALIGCSRANASGPKWPAPSTTGEDGGESLAPKPGAGYAVAIEKSDEPEPKADEATDDKDAAPDADSSDAEPAASDADEPEADEPIETEAITIEIDDDDDDE